MRRVPLVLTLLAVAALGAACASGSSSEEPVAKAVPVPGGSPLAKVQTGMSESEVRQILGEPTSANAYQTGKAWIPFYWGPDTHRKDYKYKGIGRVVFSRNRWSGNAKVIRVDYDPAEDGG